MNVIIEMKVDVNVIYAAFMDKDAKVPKL